MNCSFLWYCFSPLRIATVSHDSTVRIWEKESRGKNKLKTGCLSLAISDSCQEKKIGCIFLFGCEKANCLGYLGDLLTLSILLMANLASVNHEDSGLSLLDIYWLNTSFLCGYRMRRYCRFFWMRATDRYFCMGWWKVCYCLFYLLLF